MKSFYHDNCRPGFSIKPIILYEIILSIWENEH
ncbi:hypothetical protein KC19_3G212800 [Ceratodon purpureus]|uniref:Uncharacterized protein n=1 Tax=Ceratodon purpureus TaxID=3225 RepID=A0A8T0IL08_CERPU|nr:hypothetical protein KC19_3G212800 [Ceratodon purpureus]